MKIWIFLALIAFLLLGYSGYLLYTIYFSEPQYFEVIGQNDNFNLPDNSLNNYSGINEEYPEGILFYDLIRFPDKHINYSIDKYCNEKREESIVNAFNELQIKTVLSFNRVEENGMIEATCSDKLMEIPGDHFIAGEGGPYLIINATKYQVILNGKILLFEDESCDSPIITTHEILHAIGFKHSINPISIMYNVSNCDQKVNANIIEKISELYQDSSLPDLDFISINATKQGISLNFQVEVMNIGLKDAENVELYLYADDKRISSYNLGEMQIGEGQLIKVENLQIGYLASNLIFILDENNSISEINKKNNKRILNLQRET